MSRNLGFLSMASIGVAAAVAAMSFGGGVRFDDFDDRPAPRRGGRLLASRVSLMASPSDLQPRHSKRRARRQAAKNRAKGQL